MPKDSNKRDSSNNQDDSSQKTLLEELQAKLEESEARSAEYLEGWQRAKADFINARKDDERGRAELIKYATAGLMNDTIAVLDSFNLAMMNKEQWESVDKGWRTGVEYIYHQLLGVLQDNGLREIGKVGEHLDLSIHQPIEEIATEVPDNDGRIAEVFQRGYKVADKVIRPAHVKIYKSKE